MTTRAVSMHRRQSALIGCLLSLPALAGAVDLPFASDTFKLQGFGTIAGLYSTAGDQVTFLRDKTQPGSDQDGRLDWQTDSRLGVQANWKPIEEVEAMLQLVSKYRYDGSYRPQVTWAYVKYAFTPDLWMRAGRLGFDIYLNSESRDAGYYYLWVRPPTDYYGHIYYSYMDGMDLTSTRSFGDGILQAKVFAGTLDETVPARNGTNYPVEGTIWGGQIKYQTPNWLFSTGFGLVRVENDYQAIDSLIGALRSAGTPLARSVADGLGLSDRDFLYYAAGVAYEKGPLQTLWGLSRIESDSISYPGNLAGAWTLGYRLGRWTPFVSLARIKSDHPSLF